MLIYHGLQSLPSPPALRLLARELAALGSVAWRARRLECVQAPPGLRYPLSARSRRLMKTSRVSAW